MKAEHIHNLTRLARKPGLTPSAQVIITRRICRLFISELARIHAERRALRRQAVELRKFLPFTTAAVADLERQAGAHQVLEQQSFRLGLVVLGQQLLKEQDGISAALGFERLADLLNINPAHREQARQDGGDSLQGLAFIARAEDSAEQHGGDWGDGGPLFRACLAAACEFIRNAPEGTLPDPFAPGAPFGPKPRPTLRVV